MHNDVYYPYTVVLLFKTDNLFCMNVWFQRSVILGQSDLFVDLSVLSMNIGRRPQFHNIYPNYYIYTLLTMLLFITHYYLIKLFTFGNVSREVMTHFFMTQESNLRI